MLCRLNKTKWRVSGFKNGKFKSSWQKRPSCFSNVMASEVRVEDWKKFGGVMRVFFVKSIGLISKCNPFHSFTCCKKRNHIKLNTHR